MLIREMLDKLDQLNEVDLARDKPQHDYKMGDKVGLVRSDKEIELITLKHWDVTTGQMSGMTPGNLDTKFLERDVVEHEPKGLIRGTLNKCFGCSDIDPIGDEDFLPKMIDAVLGKSPATGGGEPDQ